MDTEKKLSQAGKLMSKFGSSKGGKERAKRLSPERRKEIARNAVLKRWEKYEKDKKKSD